MKVTFVRQILRMVPFFYSLTDNKVGGEKVADLKECKHDELKSVKTDSPYKMVIKV
jgi:hypothetical protein